MSLLFKILALAPLTQSQCYLFRKLTMDEHEAVSRHDGVAASVAVAASGASVTGSAANVDMDAPADFFHWEALRKTEMFQKLFHQVLFVVSPHMVRQCLTHHTTMSSRRHRAPVESLSSCGMNTAILSPSQPVMRQSGPVDVHIDNVYVHAIYRTHFTMATAGGSTTILPHVQGW